MSDTPLPPAPAGEMNPAECALQLKQRFPALFAGPAKPLKLRIQADIQERAPGVFTKRSLSAFLRRHTGSTSYLVALTKAAHRFDLDGQPAGEITDEHREAAQQELARRRELRQQREQQEEQQRRDRAQLLRDFERTTLTPANFCALKGLSAEELEATLALAREEAAQRPPAPPRARDDRPPQGRGPRDDRGQRPPRGPRPGGRPQGDRDASAQRGARPPRKAAEG